MSSLFRHRVPIATYDESQLDAELRAAGVPIAGLCGGTGAVLVLFASDPGAAVLSQAETVVAAHSPDPDGPKKRARAEAVRMLMSRDDPLGIALRAVISDLYTRDNDSRQARGQTRRTPEEILSDLAAAIAAGAGDPTP